jgi:hypothetical protein
VAVPGLVAVALSLTAAFGGFTTAKEPPPERYAVGQVIDQTWFHTQVMRAYVAQADGQKPGIPALHVELRVVNMTNDSTYQDPIITLGAAKQTSMLRTDWQHSASMNVYADGKRRGFLASQVKRPSGTDTYTLPPHIPVIMDTQWEMYTYGEKPGNIQVSVTGFQRQDKAFFDIPRYWTVIAEPEKRGISGLQDEKPKMIATVPVPLSPSGFKPHPPVTKHKHKPKPKPPRKRHHKHRKPR